jgi:8-oxo-dGTP pyrophosphatase MutT (NUDIX family)
MENVDILMPPDFKKSGKVKTIVQAWEDADWIGTFNLWILRRDPEPSILYQQRPLDAIWEPGKLDVSVGGHYSAGEEIQDGLREAKEELGRDYAYSDLSHLGRRLNINFDTKGRRRQNVVEVFMIEDNAPLKDFVLQKEEVTAIFVCPILQLLDVFENDGSFPAQGIDQEGKPLTLNVDKNSFPYNWDHYHYKAAVLANRYFKGEKPLFI